MDSSLKWQGKSWLGGGFKDFFISTPKIGEDDPIWLTCFKGVETTNQMKFGGR